MYISTTEKKTHIRAVISPTYPPSKSDLARNISHLAHLERGNRRNMSELQFMGLSDTHNFPHIS